MGDTHDSVSSSLWCLLAWLLIYIMCVCHTTPLMQLEEKRIPYVMEKINMRCYGDKPASFLSKVWGVWVGLRASPEHRELVCRRQGQ